MGKDGKGSEPWPALGSGSGLALIKIDCEGCEEWFLAAAAELIKAWRPVIVIEIWNDELRRQNGARPAAWPALAAAWVFARVADSGATCGGQA